jgi:hypothetical protein
VRSRAPVGASRNQVLAQIFVPSSRLGIWISRKVGALAGARLYLIRRVDIQPPATNPTAPELALPARLIVVVAERLNR